VNDAELEPLDTLIGGYLNGDWPGEYGDPWGAAQAFVTPEPDYAPLVPTLIHRVLAGSSSEEALERALARIGLGYRPSVDGSVSYRTWLLAVADRGRRAATQDAGGLTR